MKKNETWIFKKVNCIERTRFICFNLISLQCIFCTFYPIKNKNKSKLMVLIETNKLLYCFDLNSYGIVHCNHEQEGDNWYDLSEISFNWCHLPLLFFCTDSWMKLISDYFDGMIFRLKWWETLFFFLFNAIPVLVEWLSTYHVSKYLRRSLETS